MSRALSIAALAAALSACTGQGIDRSDAVPIAANLAVRPVADGDPFVDTLAATAQDTLAGPELEARMGPRIDVTQQVMTSRSLPPVRSQRISSTTRERLVELVDRAGPAPAHLSAAYERERDDRWSLVVVRAHEGMELAPTTLVKLAWGTEPREQGEPEGVYLLLDREDGQAFERLTLEHDGRRLAIMTGDEVLMAPTVQEPIGGGQLLITAGNGSSAGDLYQRLTGHAAPAPARP